MCSIFQLAEAKRCVLLRRAQDKHNETLKVMSVFPAVESLEDPRNAATTTMLLGLLSSGAWALCRPLPAQRVGCCMALLFLALPLLPACQLFLPVGTVLGERLLYTPSIGYCLLVGWAADSTSEGSQRRQQQQHPLTAALLAGTVSCSCCYAALTFQRCYVWYDDATLFSDAVQACPNSAKIHATLGAIAMQARDASAAELHFRRAVEIFPEYDDGLYSLGRLYFEGAVPEKQHEAGPLLLRAVEANPVHDNALDYYGQLLARSGKLEEAEAMMEKGLLASRRANLALMRNLGVVKRALGKARDGESLIAEADATERAQGLL
jgi:tetratricopeptide (TPR) repeat protein